MGKIEVFEVEGKALPPEWRAKLGLSDGALVRVTLEERPHDRPVDVERLREIQRRFAALPTLDDRSDGEIIGYNEQGVLD